MLYILQGESVMVILKIYLMCKISQLYENKCKYHFCCVMFMKFSYVLAASRHNI